MKHLRLRALVALLALLAVGSFTAVKRGSRPVDGSSEKPRRTASAAAMMAARLRPVPSEEADSATRTGPERWEEITPARMAQPAIHLPVRRGHAGPSVLRIQAMLDRAFFSPGMIDGRWGRNTETAVYWLQSREGLPATGQVDSATYARLVALAGSEGVRTHVLSAADVAGPFIQIPADVYQHAKLRCSCYRSLAEKLTESFHASGDLLARLNPGRTLNALKAGDRLVVPAIRAANARAAATVREVVVSGSGSYVHARDAGGRILYHFPTTLGSTFDPSPDGDFRITGVTRDPWWLYQPARLANVPDDRPNARIPPGPNSSVGKVWVSLSLPHYGIHGTKSPETIGYATSSGCVRLTNWDVLFLASRLPVGTTVRFRETRGATRGTSTAREALPPISLDSVGARGVIVDMVARGAGRVIAPPPPAARDSVVTSATPPAPAPETARP